MRRPSMVTCRPSSVVSSTTLCSSPRRTPSDTTSSTALSSSSVVATVGLPPRCRPTSVQRRAAGRSFAQKAAAEGGCEAGHPPCEQGQQPGALQRGDELGAPATAQHDASGWYGERRRDEP